MVRGALVSLIHEKLMLSRSTSYDDSRAVALVTTDVSAVESIAHMFHESWAYVLELAVGIFLLSEQIGWLWPTPLLIISGGLVPALSESFSLVSYVPYALKVTSVLASWPLRSQQPEATAEQMEPSHASSPQHG